MPFDRSRSESQGDLPEGMSEATWMQALSELRSSNGTGAVALQEESMLKEVWEMYLDSEILLEEPPVEPIARRVKLAISRIAGAFALESSSMLSPFALTPMPELRAGDLQSEDLLSSATFKFAEPKIPGCIFSLEIKTLPNGTGFFWQTSGNGSSILYLKLYINNNLHEMQNLSVRGAEFLLPADLTGMIHFEAELAMDKNVQLIEFEV
ncbi:MAG: hypothetical protein KDK41_10250 [Leptospiraceae bacterium]|nr:hypothetical protein [Leptospiraceae bacterium]